MTTQGLPQIEPLAPIVDQIREIAQEELPAPRTARIHLWDNGNYEIQFYHSMGKDAGQLIEYDTENGAVLWKYREGVTIESTYVSEETGTVHESVYEVTEERQITTIEPPSI